MPDLFSVQDRVAVVTGGLGQLGGQYAAALLDAGAKVALLDSAAGDLPDALVGRDGNPSLLSLTADVTDRGSLEQALEAVVEQLGAPTGLINNAALDSPPDAPAGENGPFESYPRESWDRVLEVNVTGSFLACQVFGDAMAKAGGGSIVNVSSIYGVVSPDQRLYEHRRRSGEEFFKPVAYSVSKSAVLNLTRYLATYWAGAGVRVNTLTLGGVKRDQDAEFLREYEARVPLGRMAHEDDYNGAVIFLLSDASRYMTGANLVIDGGWTAW